MTDDITEMERRYLARLRHKGLYAEFRPEIVENRVERWRELVSLLTCVGIEDLSDKKILEIGAGAGGRVLELIMLGARPENITCNELIQRRMEMARERLPATVTFHGGDASLIPIADQSMDIVYQSTVFSSILDDALQAKIAEQMWRWIKPGGGVLWYDFIYDNPSNPDVRKVTLGRMKALFPAGKITTRKVTLAPPIARRVVKVHPSLYRLCRTLPFLRTHVLCYIKKASP